MFPSQAYKIIFLLAFSIIGSFLCAADGHVLEIQDKLEESQPNFDGNTPIEVISSYYLERTGKVSSEKAHEIRKSLFIGKWQMRQERGNGLFDADILQALANDINYVIDSCETCETSSPPGLFGMLFMFNGAFQGFLIRDDAETANKIGARAGTINPFLRLLSISPGTKFPISPVHFSKSFVHFLRAQEKKIGSYGKERDFKIETHSSRDEVFARLPKSEGLVNSLHFGGTIEEVFAYNEDIATVLANFQTSIKDFRNFQVSFYNTLHDTSISERERWSLLGVNKKGDFQKRSDMLYGTFADLDKTLSVMKSLHPSLMNIYLFCENLLSGFSHMNALADAQVNGKIGASLVKEMRTYAEETILFSSDQVAEHAIELLMPYMNRFLELAGEAPRTAMKFSPTLHQHIAAQDKRLEKAQKLREQALKKKTLVMNAPKQEAKNSGGKKSLSPPKNIHTSEAQIKPKVVHHDPIPFPNTTSTTTTTTTTTVVSSTIPSETSELDLKQKELDLARELELAEKRAQRAAEKEEKQKNLKKTDEERAEEKRKERQEIVIEFKKSKAETEKEKNQRILVRTLNKSQAAQLLSNLNTDNLEIFEHIFNLSDLVITPANVKNLAEQVQIYMNIIFDTPGEKYFKNSIKDREHKAHRSKDTGDKYPSFYLRKVRRIFESYGVQPAGWEEGIDEEYKNTQPKKT